MKRRFPTDLETAQSLNKVQREELARLHSESEKKDAAVKALADALKHLIRAIENDDDVLGCIEAGEDALRLAGRLP